MIETIFYLVQEVLLRTFKMASNSLIKLNVGGQIFETSVHTVTKYPGSMLCAMFSHTKNGISPMPTTRDGHYFLDADPEYFRIILNWLRLGEIVTEDSNSLKGVMALANYFGLEELMEEISMRSQIKTDTKPFTFWRKPIPEIVYLHFGKKKYRGYKEEPFEIRKSNLTRVPDSTISKYFSGDDTIRKSYLPIADTAKPDHFVIDRRRDDPNLSRVNAYPDQNHNLDQYVFEFFECETSTRLLLFPDSGQDKTDETLEKFKQELLLYGISENIHYKVEHIDFENDSDSEIDNTFKYRHEYCFKWNDEFILKYK